MVQDENGDMLVFAVGDVSWCPSALGSKLKLELSKELDIPETHIILSGTHTHASSLPHPPASAPGGAAG